MNLAYSRLKKKLKFLNSKSCNSEMIERILKREKIRYVEYPMVDQLKGYYSNELRRTYRKKMIAINSKLSAFEKRYVILHELVHHFLHVQTNRKYIFNWHVARLNDTKQDREADTLSLILAIPLQELISMTETNHEEISPEYAEKLNLRKEIYEKYGI